MLNQRIRIHVNLTTARILRIYFPGAVIQYHHTRKRYRYLYDNERWKMSNERIRSPRDSYSGTWIAGHLLVPVQSLS